MLRQFDTQQGHVVVGVFTVTVFLNGGFDHVDDLLRGEPVGLGHQVEDALVREQFLGGILCLVQTVGVEEHHLAADVVDAFTFESETLEEPEGEIGMLHVQETAVEDGSVVAAVAELQSAAGS